MDKEEVGNRGDRGVAPEWLLKALRAAWDAERAVERVPPSLLGHLSDIVSLSYDCNRPLMSMAEMLEYCEELEGVSESDILLTLVEVSRAAGVAAAERLSQ